MPRARPTKAATQSQSKPKARMMPEPIAKPAAPMAMTMPIQ